MTVPDLLDPDLIADPYTGYGKLREEAAVCSGRNVDGSPMWYVTRQSDVRTVLSDPRFVNNPASVPGGIRHDARAAALRKLGITDDLAPYLTDSILSADGADHTRLRKLVSRAFTVRRVARLRPRVEEITAELLDGLADPAELIEQFAYPLPIRVVCELVGVPEEERADWRRWGTALATFDPQTVPTAVREMVDHVHELVALRRAHPVDDLLTALVQAHEEGDQLSDGELVTMVFALVMAGHETTAHLIGNGTVALLTHPDQLALLHRDPDLWPGAVHELMRWCGPVTATGIRYAADDLELGGVRIARGDAVEAVIASANRDPRAYPDPDRLDLTRRPAGRGDGHVGFGHGIHYCLGAALARQEGEVALKALFTRFPDLALVDPTPTWLPRPGMRRLARLPVRLGRPASVDRGGR